MPKRVRYTEHQSPGAQNLSSYNYVPMRSSLGRYGAVKIRPKNTCEHQLTVCLECVDSWSWDHEIQFKVTSGGRSLLEAALSMGTLIEFNQFNGDNTVKRGVYLRDGGVVFTSTEEADVRPEEAVNA